jgi:hypothetical protein
MKTDDGRQKAEDRRQKTEERGEKRKALLSFECCPGPWALGH